MDSIMGTIILFAGNFAPKSWSYCDGSLLQINQNQALFSILGTQYGGDGQTTFALPKLTPVENSGDGKTRSNTSSAWKVSTLPGIK